MQFQVDAAIAGSGIALLPTWIGDRSVAENKLVPILPKYSTTSPLHVLTSGGRHLPRRVALLRDFFVERLTPACTTPGHQRRGC